ncbi:MAG: hypothetical protein QOD98_2502 [Nocardioidaceae bacterium]|jgi:hypothetical protein|nr:hypothetical protein [Nocardioidaceae bacterium]
MGTRVAALVLLLALTGCSGDDSTDQPGSGKTKDADCAVRIPDAVFDTLRWSPPKAAEATVRGCHRETEQGYVEVRDRTGYDKLCKTLDRSGGVRPGVPVDWLGDDVVACAVEPAGDVGQTKVVVQGEGDAVTQVTIAVLTSTSQELVRAAVEKLVA